MQIKKKKKKKKLKQINFAGYLARDGNTNITTFFMIEEAKETNLDFSQVTVKIL